MRHLVLGSAGLIGSYLINHLRMQKITVDTFDIKDSLDQDLRLHHDADSKLSKLIEQADFIYFLAFDVGGCKYLTKHQHDYNYIDNNMRIMQNTFRLLEGKRFIFASTQLINTPGAYGSLKTIGEHYTHSLDGLVVRLWNIYGFEPPCIKSHVVCDFIHQALTLGKISMFSDGSEERQFLHGSDCSYCLSQLAAQYDSLDRKEPMDISSFEWTRISDLAKLVASYAPDTEIVSGSFNGHVNKIEPKSTILQYVDRHFIDLKKGIESLVFQYKDWILETGKINEQHRADKSRFRETL